MNDPTGKIVAPFRAYGTHVAKLMRIRRALDVSEAEALRRAIDAYYKFLFLTEQITDIPDGSAAMTPHPVATE